MVNASPSLRYYADNRDQTTHNRIIELLTEINHSTIFSVEVIRIKSQQPDSTIPDSFPGRVTDCRFRLQQVYEDDFSYNEVLSRNLGAHRTPSEVFKSKNGIHIDGAVAVVNSNDEVVWATENRSAIDGSGSQDQRKWAVNLLECICAHGIEAVKDLLEDEDMNTEERVITRFVEAEPIKGEAEREVAVGREFVDTGDITGNYEKMLTEGQPPRQIDLVIKSESIYWVIEAKNKYEAETFDTALGQAIVSAELFQSERSLDAEVVQPAMLFGNTTGTDIRGIQQELFSIGSLYGIEIFTEDPDSGIRHVTAK